MPVTCSYPRCRRVLFSRELCAMHYHRQREGRDMAAPRDKRRNMVEQQGFAGAGIQTCLVCGEAVRDHSISEPTCR